MVWVINGQALKAQEYLIFILPVSFGNFSRNTMLMDRWSRLHSPLSQKNPAEAGFFLKPYRSKIKTVEHHHLIPRGNEVADESVFGIVIRIGFSHCAEFRIRTEN